MLFECPATGDLSPWWPVAYPVFALGQASVLVGAPFDPAAPAPEPGDGLPRPGNDHRAAVHFLCVIYVCKSQGHSAFGTSGQLLLRASGLHKLLQNTIPGALSDPVPSDHVLAAFRHSPDCRQVWYA